MRRLSVGQALIALAACGDPRPPAGAPLLPAPDLTVVAHQDDDLLFMQPDVADLAARGRGLTNVYVTAGNGRRGIVAADIRYRGLMEAYAWAAGAPSRWDCGWISLADHLAEHCRLDGAPISLVFLGYPDGGKEGELHDSLLHLWDGSIDGADTIARRPTRYDRDGLIAAVADAIARTAPATIRTLDVAATHGRDHADHEVVGALAVLAAARAGYEHALLSFRGYSMDEEPEDVTGAFYDRALGMLTRYHACASGCARCGSACATIIPAHLAWAHRRYAIGRRAPAAGRLRMGDRCAVAGPAGAVALGDCAGAPAWRFEASGAVRAGDRCLGALPSGELAAVAPAAGAACPADGAHRFLLDDEGHLWVGRAPDPPAVRRGVHALCVDEQARASACGDGHAPAWELVAQDVAAVARPAWLAEGGRAVRLGPLGLCAIDDGQLACAKVSPAPPVIGEPARLGALPIEPESLAFATEGTRVLACGRTAQGLVCAAPGEPPAPWSSALAQQGPATAGDRSLAGFPGELCGLDERGVICARRAPAAPDLRSPWPPRGAALWPGDLDGDRQIDWCAGGPDGARCGRAADRPLTSDGIPWTFHQGGVAAASPAEVALGALTDVDGDGLADLCTVHERRIVCARSQRYGFGPAVPIARLPPGPPPRALWMHGASACVDDGATISCTVPLPR